MRLTRNQIEVITQNLLHNLIKEGTISTEEPGAVLERLSAVFEEDLAAEDRLNEEVREILQKHGEEMARGDINYQEMFRKVKNKLARDRDLIL